MTSTKSSKNTFNHSILPQKRHVNSHVHNLCKKKMSTPRWFNSWPFHPQTLGWSRFNPLKKGHLKLFTIPKRSRLEAPRTPPLASACGPPLWFFPLLLAHRSHQYFGGWKRPCPWLVFWPCRWLQVVTSFKWLEITFFRSRGWNFTPGKTWKPIYFWPFIGGRLCFWAQFL